MRRFIAIRSGCIGVITVLALGLSCGEASQEKYTLRRPPVAGQVYLLDSRFSMSMLLTITSGEEIVEMDVSNKNERSLREEILAVDLQGNITSMKRTIVRAIAWERALGAQAETRRVDPLQGTTIVIRRAGGKTSVTAEKGKMTAQDQTAAVRSLDQRNSPDIPAGELSIGHEWTADPKPLALVFTSSDVSDLRASMRCRFEEVTDRAGERCAAIRDRTEVTATIKALQVPMRVQIESTRYVSLQSGLTIGEEASGKCSIKGETTQGGLAIKVSADGPIQYTGTIRLLKLPAQKPVNTSG